MIDRIVSLAEQPDLTDAMWAVPGGWPAFMDHDPVANMFYEKVSEEFPEHQLVAIDASGTAIARVNAVPFAWTGADDDLPARGWDAILERAFAERWAGQTPTAVSLLEARVAPGCRGMGLSSHLLTAARATTARLGMTDLFGPVRPAGKTAHPHLSMTEYAARTRADGLPADPWIRTHARLGGRVVAVCPLSMTITGTLAQWRNWTGLPLTRSGPVTVPGTLAPVHVSVEHDHAVYVEANVWMHHRIT
nr:N-acetyltransferase [Kibdelosporangium sp. MJ126-NF4]CEL19796.1 hypothetical protein [Kibdelosporangium sp. MJ126-NF4]CTQ97021.1 hypothetical protein [Kibdelosporangium sp. MJ126-NF4]